MNTLQISSDELLTTVYRALEFESGTGWFQFADSSRQPNLTQIGWYKQADKLNKADNRFKADAIFFVRDYPTVLFFKLDFHPDTDTELIEEELRQLHLKVWNTSRIPLFFVAFPGELRIYSAYQKPVRNLETWRSEDRWLKQVKIITQVAEAVEALKEFSRPAVESGHLFQNKSKDFERENRVDQWLLKNLRLLRKKLEGAERKKREYAHALIGRSIFIRYLEDRKVLVEDYFADKSLSKNGEYQRYTDVLTSKKDTYNLFHKLRDDFNGDLFPLSDEEEKEIDDDDVRLLREFLLGKGLGDQADLFFWAYQFDIIPIELISNIYEEFYHEHSSGEDKGTHYTPTTLVDFVLTQCLTAERLDADAKILDPACGSGIFLVEAFKRLVYHECYRKNVPELSRADLIKLLTERIFGIDVNKAAVQVAAFSLYLAFLEFRDPPDIRQHKKLPKLVYEPNQADSGRNLFHGNTFYLTPIEQVELKKRLEQNEQYAGRADDERMSKQPVLPLKAFQFDVVVGNPPWGTVDSSDNQLATQWCKVFRYPVGYKELSQCFIWRAQQLLKPGGEIGLLVSTGILFKHEKKSKSFRQRWLQQNRIRAVYNFAHVRHVFFRKQKSEAIAPFAAVFFAPAQLEEALRNKISYVSIKRSAFVEQLQAVLIDKTDLRKASQGDFWAKDWLWKTYMWGGLNDVDLIEELKSCCSSMNEIVDDSGRGFGDIRGKYSTDDLKVKFELPNDSFGINAPLAQLKVPIKRRSIRRLGNLNLYKGSRLIVKRGISRGGFKLGEIQARLADDPFAFTDKFMGFRLDHLNEVQKTVLTGSILSSLAKYYHFLTCATWGLWHHTIDKEEHLYLPIIFPEDQALQNRIIDAVEQIVNRSDTPNLFDFKSPGWRKMQDELDEAIFDLYGLSEAQKDLVRDLCQVTFEFFYKSSKSQPAKPPALDRLKDYCDAFLETWRERLASQGKELEAQIYAPYRGLLVGISFDLKDLGTAVTHKPIIDDSEWQIWFKRLCKTLRKEYSAGIYIDSIVKVLHDSSMLIVKRAERRLWTKSQARQDAQELLTEVFKLEWQRNRSRVDDLGVLEFMG